MYLMQLNFFYIFITIQSICTFYEHALDSVTESQQSIRLQIRTAFGRDFFKVPEQGEVTVWKISNNKQNFVPEDYTRNGFNIFRSNETYLLFARHGIFALHTYYWIGKEVPLEDKLTVATFAVTFHDLMSQYYRGGNATLYLSRECEMFESESFHHTINSIAVTYQISGRDVPNRDVHVPLEGPNLYIVKGTVTTTRIKKVPINLKWMKPDICLLMEAGPCIEEIHPVTIFCGNRAGELVQTRSLELGAEIVSAIYKVELPGLETVGNHRYKALVELLEDSNFHQPVDFDHSNDELKDGYEFVLDRDKDVSLLELSNYNFLLGEIVDRTDVSDRPLHSNLIRHGKNYLFDSGSAADLFFIFGAKASLNAKVAAIQEAEKYLHDKVYSASSRPIRMRITSTRPREFIFDFAINLIDQLSIHRTMLT